MDPPFILLILFSCILPQPPAILPLNLAPHAAVGDWPCAGHLRLPLRHSPPPMPLAAELPMLPRAATHCSISAPVGPAPPRYSVVPHFCFVDCAPSLPYLHRPPWSCLLLLAGRLLPTSSSPAGAPSLPCLLPTPTTRAPLTPA